jgi:hypothetical protein
MAELSNRSTTPLDGAIAPAVVGKSLRGVIATSFI